MMIAMMSETNLSAIDRRSVEFEMGVSVSQQWGIAGTNDRSNVRIRGIL